MNFLRWLLIASCHLLPSWIGRRAAWLCNRYVPAYVDQAGGFRTDVGLCALGLLRRGDIEGFLYWVWKYPFDNRWAWMVDPRWFRVAYNAEQGWHVGTTKYPRQYGKAILEPLRPEEHASAPSGSTSN